MKQISSDLRNSIKSCLSNGVSMRNVAKQLGVGLATVSKYKNEHLPELKMSVGGGISKITDAKKRIIKRDIMTGKLKTAAEVFRDLVNEGYNVSYTTVRRTLNSMGFMAKIKKKKPLLSKKNIQNRFKWAKKYQHWTIKDWKRIIWSDETKINIWGSDGVKYYWVRPGDPLKPHHLDLTVKHGGGSLMMWGCMSYHGIGHACHIQEIMNANVYCEILRTSLKQSLDSWSLSTDEFIFQQDNDPKHKSKLAKEWFTKEGIEILDWPAQSPDLNPIEHLWHHLKLKLSLYDKKATSINELWERCDKEWNSFTVETCRKYVETMPDRIKALIRAKGAHTNY